MNVCEIEVIQMNTSGYSPLKVYDQWRVAVLAYCPDVRPEAITAMQKHNLTDEVFVLLKGNCVLFSGGFGEKPADVTGVRMEPGKVYNVKKGCWHNHVLDEEGAVLIVENDDTHDDNSPVLPLTARQITQVLAICEGELKKA